MQIPSQGFGRELFLAQVFNAVLLVCLASVAALGQSVLPNELYSFRGSVGANASVEPIAVVGQSFAQGYRVTVGGTSAKGDDAGLFFRTAHAVGQGDNLQLTFRVRKIAPLDATTSGDLLVSRKPTLRRLNRFTRLFPAMARRGLSTAFRSRLPGITRLVKLNWFFTSRTGRRLLKLAVSV